MKFSDFIAEGLCAIRGLLSGHLWPLRRAIRVILLSIRWRPLLFIALTWWFIITFPGCVAWIGNQGVHPCEPRNPITCEP